MWQHLLGCIVPVSANNLFYDVKWNRWVKFKFSFSQEKEFVKSQWYCWNVKNFAFEKQFYLYRLLFIFSIVSFSINIKIFLRVFEQIKTRFQLLIVLSGNRCERIFLMRQFKLSNLYISICIYEIISMTIAFSVSFKDSVFLCTHPITYLLIYFNIPKRKQLLPVYPISLSSSKLWNIRRSWFTKESSHEYLGPYSLSLSNKQKYKRFKTWIFRRELSLKRLINAANKVRSKHNQRRIERDT